MRRVFLLGLFVGLGIVVGCSKKPPAPVVVADPAAEAIAKPVAPPKDVSPGEDTPASAAELARKEKYDAAVRSALNLVAEQKYADALGILETAQLVNDTEEVRREIERVKGLLTRSTAVDKTVQDIRTVLKEGNPDDAAKLAADALKQFGDGNDAQKLSELKVQADAVAAAGLDDPKDRLAKFVKEGQTALDENNFRAAVLAFEMAVEAGAAADIRQRLDDVKERLVRYDDLRQKAAELRRDPFRIEDAVALLEDARKAWDTLQVRQDIDDYRLALLKRRDRLSVAEFEIRGAPDIDGRTIAEELLPQFKTRYDVVERAQLSRLLDELKLDAPGDLAANLDAQRELGQLGKIRYLVVGSVSTLGGIRVNARLVEVNTGLVVQTGKIVGRSVDEVVKLLPELARMLMMNDEDRIALENQLAQKAHPIEVAVVQPAEVPPAPPVPDMEQPAPPPVVPFNPKPPEFGNLQLDDFNRFAPAPDQAPPAPVVIFPATDPLRQRFLLLNLQLGDNLFRRGRFREAFRHYEIALNLAPGNVDVLLRLERCRPFLGGPVVVVPVVRPRIAVLSFFTFGDPRFLPLGIGDWAAEYLAAQYYPYYDVVDRAELYWWMARLGLSMRDVMYNPAARFWLARAVGVRFFVFGYVQQTASFNVSTSLVDAETGVRQGFGFIHVRDVFEMKLRMGELIRQMQMDPLQRDAVVRFAQDNERLLIDIRRLLRERHAAEALALGRPVLLANPYNVALRTLLATAERQAETERWAEARRRSWQEQQAQIAAVNLRNAELAREAERARLRAEQEARERERDAEARRAWERRRERAAENLNQQGQSALNAKNFAIAAGLLASAVALRPSDDSSKRLAEARALQEAQARDRAAAELARREALRRKEEQAELAKLRTQLDAERQARLTEELNRKKAQEARDQAAFIKLLADGRTQLQQQHFDAAIAAFDSARQLRGGDEVQKLLDSAREQKARADAAKLNAAERAAQEKKLADEKKVRVEAEALAKKNQERYDAALTAAKQALAAKRYEEAVQKYREAGQIFQTEAVTAGLRQAGNALADQRAALDAEQKKKAAAEQTLAKFRQLLDTGKARLTAKDFEGALKVANEALQLKPGDPEAAALLTSIEKARTVTDGDAKAKLEAKRKMEEYQKLLGEGKQQLASKKYDDAIKTFQKALDLMPGDATTSDLLKSAQKAKQDDSGTQVATLLQQAQTALAANDLTGAANAYNAAAKLAPNDPAVVKFQALLQKAQTNTDVQKKLLAEFQNHVVKARQAYTAKQYDVALTELAAADKLIGNDKEALALRRDVEKARADADALAKKNQEEKKLAEYNRLMALGQTSLKSKRYTEAVQAYRDALKTMPNDAKATQALAEAQKALDLSKTPPKPTPQDTYAKAMQTAATAEKQGHWADAVQAYRDALKAMPNDAKATQALRNAELQMNLDDGQKALKAKRYQDATKAFEAALRIQPNNKDAQDGLKRAKAGK